MKQIWPNYSYSPTTNVLTLTGLNIDRDQLLLVTAADRGRIMYNFADSSVTASAFTSGANTALTLVATTAGLTTTAALVIYYDDQIPGISGTVTAGLGQFALLSGFGAGIASADEDNTPYYGVQIGYTDAANNFAYVRPGTPLPISGTVTASLFDVTDPIQDNGTSGKTVAIKIYDSGGIANGQYNASPVFVGGTVTIGTALPAGTNRIGVVTIGAGTVTLGASTSQIGSVTASISGTVPISISSVTVGNSLTIGSLPALAAGTAQIGSVTASISNSVTISSLPALAAGTAQIGSVTASISNSITIASLPAISGTVTANTFALQGTAVTTSNFTSTTASTVLANYNSTREVLTIFNEGAGNLHIAPGATCTTVQYQVRLSSGDYYEVPNHQTTITHSAVFATAGTARVTQLS